MIGLARCGYSGRIVTGSWRSAVRRLAVALVGVVVVCCRPAAALDEASRCFHDKLGADRRATVASLNCTRVEAGDSGRRERCLERVQQRLRRRLATAEERAARTGFTCPASAEALGFDLELSWPVRLLDEAVGNGSADCRRSKVGAARRFATAYSRCVESDVLPAGGSHDDFETCATRARDVFDADWRTPVPAAFCVPSAHWATEAAAARIEREIDESASRLKVRCGDRFVGGFEECDDGNSSDDDGCSADCRKEDCARIGKEVRCVACPDDAVATPAYDGCRCGDGFAGEPGSCADVDECAVPVNPCADRPCVNLPGTWACAIPCTADSFHQALASCGAPSGAIAFDCSDAVIPLPAGVAGKPREVECDGLTIDGAGRNVSFELAPLCWQTVVDPSLCPGGLEDDGTCFCPDVDSGEVFLMLRGDGNVVRDLGVRAFFDGIPARGRGNIVENVRFERMCDDAFGSVVGGVGNIFRHLTVRDGCDKCSENDGELYDTDPDPRVPEHFNSILEDVEFDSCRAPVRVSTSGRFLLRDVRMNGGDEIFPCDGPRFSSTSDAERVVVHLERSRIEGCRRGIRFGRGADGVISDSRISDSGLRGIRAASTSRVSVEGTTIEANGGSGSTEAGFGGVALVESATVDLGGGELEIDGATVTSAGENSLCWNEAPDDSRRDLDNATPLAVAARGNWWCSAESPAPQIAGTADFSEFLDRAPLRVLPSASP